MTTFLHPINPAVPFRGESIMAAPDNLLTRIRGEYEEMPGLQLTLAQACRLWQVDTTTGECLLETLIRQNFLMRSRDGAFIAGPRWRERPAPQEAALRPGATVAPHASTARLSS